MDFLAIANGAARAIDAQQQHRELAFLHLAERFTTRLRAAPAIGPVRLMRAMRLRRWRRRGQTMGVVLVSGSYAGRGA